MQKLNRRKFLQLCAVGAVTAARWLVTGGKKTENEKPKPKLAGRPVKWAWGDPDSWISLSAAPVEYELQKSIHYKFTEDRTAWRLKSKQPPKHFVLLEPSEQMGKELEGLKAQSISILARYADD